MSMAATVAAHEPGLKPAFRLTVTGLRPRARLEPLIGTLGGWLRLEPEQALDALASPPLQLVQGSDREKLEQQQRQLSDAGCESRIEPVWCYRHWSVTPDLLARIEQAGRLNEPTVFALLHALPTPGIARLNRYVQAAGAGRYILNHGQLLVCRESASPVGAGRWLQQEQEKLEQALAGAKGPVQVFSALAICPEDAALVPELLECLDARLREGREAGRGASSESPRQVLSRPLAGRAWAKLTQLGLSPQPGQGLSAEEAGELQRHWPVDLAQKAPEPFGPQDQRQTRIVDQFRAGSIRRLERCWDLIHYFDEWKQLPSLPGVAMRAYELAQAADGNEEELGRVVRGDPALSARILSMVNSGYYGLAQKVGSIQHALVILGFEEIAELALMLSSESVFRSTSIEQGHRLWRHSAVTADIARALATRIQLPNPSTVYTAALLHDVGKVVLQAFRPEKMAELARIARFNRLPMYEMEREIFGHDHATLGAVLLRRWGLPESLCRQVEQHHGPLPQQGGMHAGAALVGLADHLAHRLAHSEGWADQMRLRRIHLETLKPALGDLDLATIDSLLQRPRLRAQGLSSARLPDLT